MTAEGKPMHISLLDVYKTRQSLIHRLDPRIKILVSLMLILSTVLLPDSAWGSQILLQLLLIILSMCARLGLSFTLRRAFIALPFLLAALPLPFLTPGPTLLVIPGLDWVMTSSGVVRFLNILVRTWIAVQASILLSATTEASDLLWGLGALRLPGLLVSIIGFMLRYLFILADEALRMLRARASRSPAIQGARKPGLLWQGRNAGAMVGSLFLRSLERSERVHAAMVARGYDGTLQALEKPRLTSLDWIALGGMTILIMAIIAVGIWSP